MPSETTTTIRRCARCGYDHENIVVRPFTRQPDDHTTHFAICPTNGEPILAQFIQTGDTEPQHGAPESDWWIDDWIGSDGTAPIPVIMEDNELNLQPHPRRNTRRPAAEGRADREGGKRRSPSE